MVRTDLTEPELGSYFVSTYPPFSVWDEAGLEPFRRVLKRPSSDAFGLYVHIPFCVRRCQYCYYLSHDDRGTEIDGYVDAVLQEARLYGETPRLAGRGPSVVYFGGGTPSLLSPAQLRRLLDGLKEVFPWTETREVSFECAPKTATATRLDTLQAAGVTRISLGVQQMDDEVLRRNDRVHLVRDVERAYAQIRRAGFSVVNIDLMVGLMGETDRSFREGLERVIEMNPECVTIYQLEIPHNTPLYRARGEKRLNEGPASWEVKRERLARGFERLEEAGYSLRSAYAAVRDPGRHRFVYQDDQYRGVDLLGIGASSFSYLEGVHQQNRASLGKYVDALARGDLPLGRGHALTDEERMVREFVLRLKFGRVDLDELAAKFALSAAERFREPIRKFTELGWLTMAGPILQTTREGLLRVDRMIPAFYLPEHRDVRYS